MKNNVHYESVPVRIKQFREHLSMIQAEFGTALGLDQTAISSMEKGRTDITLKSIYALADLGCNPMWLLLGKEPMLLSQLKQAEATLEVRTTETGKEYIIRTA